MMNGTVKNVNQEKGFGFINGEDGVEYFFHKSGVVPFSDKHFEDIMRGDKVTFEDTKGPKGPRAESVVVI